LHDRRDGDISDQRLRGRSAHTLINGASAGFGLRVESECHLKTTIMTRRRSPRVTYVPWDCVKVSLLSVQQPRYYDLDEPSQRADTCHGDEKNAVAATPSVGFETVNTFGPFNARYHKFV
jgi:hypothetical protein